jgi:hypothetical protein
MSDLDAKIDALAAENAALRERVLELEYRAGIKSRPPRPEWHPPVNLAEAVMDRMVAKANPGRKLQQGMLNGPPDGGARDWNADRSR